MIDHECGHHFYHSDCLERERQRDPQCMVCHFDGRTPPPPSVNDDEGSSNVFPGLGQMHAAHPHTCAHCQITMAERTLHLRRHPCGHAFHSHCAVLSMLQYGITLLGVVFCRQCNAEDSDSD